MGTKNRHGYRDTHFNPASVTGVTTIVKSAVMGVTCYIRNVGPEGSPTHVRNQTDGPPISIPPPFLVSLYYVVLGKEMITLFN